MKSTIIGCVLVLSINICAGACPENCKEDQTCDFPDEDCPSGGCKKGYAGRKCHPLECLIPGDNGVHYRGTHSVTSDRRRCIEWNAAGNFRTPPDGRGHNYCRHVTDDVTPNTWCYISRTDTHSNPRWRTCSIPFCGSCPQPSPRPHSMITTTPASGFVVNISITVECDVGYVIEANCEPLECLIRGDNGVHYRGTTSVTTHGAPCVNWNEVNKKTPPDGPDHNYCRHAVDNIENTWCYVYGYVLYGWQRCNIPLCDETFLARGDCPLGYYSSSQGSHTFIRRTASVKCLQDLTWSNSFPTCVESNIKCTLTSNTGERRQIRYPVGEKTQIQCSTGFQLVGSNRVTCGTNGQWIPPAQCKDIDECRNSPCGWFTTCTNLQGSFKCSCRSGYYSDFGGQCTDIDECRNSPCGRYEKCTNSQGSFRCSCRSGYYNDFGEQCTARCEKPNVEAHSFIVDERDMYKLNEALEVRCDDGYETSDSRYFQCQNDKQWNGTMPDCLAICPEPELRDHSTIVQFRRQYKENDVVEIKCDIGYETKNKTRFVCQSNRMWNGTTPQCDIIHCAPPKLSNHSYVLKSMSSETLAFQESITISCDDGYQYATEKTTLTLTCRGDKTWDQNIPMCKEKPENLSAADRSSGSNQTALFGGIGTVIFFVVVAFLIVIIFVVKKRKEKHNGPEESSIRFNSRSQNLEVDPHSDSQLLSQKNVSRNEEKINPTYANAANANDAMYYEFSIGQSPTKNAIKVDGIEEYVRRKVAEREALLADYKTFKTGLQMPTDKAKISVNEKKNKYKHIYPYDDNRVTLNVLPRQPGSDYINASYINGCGSFRKYIAAQGPIQTSVDDFWRMIWELNIKNIVMLTNVFEEGKKKCVQYWPDEGLLEFGQINVTLVQEDVFCDYLIREMTLSMNGTRKKVLQYHFTAWPDKSVPKCGSALITIINQVFGGTSNQDTPTIVHCSAGIGRTGTFIALDYLMEQAKLTGFVDFYECVANLRRQRVNMVQTKEQYIFLHEIVLEAVVYSRLAVKSSDFAETYKSLIHRDNFRTIYKTLEDGIPHIDKKELKGGKAPENKKKNRFSNIIAVDSARPYISPDEEGSDYINAVFLSSQRNQHDFIATQMPLKHTLTDFWKLVWENDAEVIVMLNETIDQSCGEYLPSSGNYLEFGRFAVTLTETQKLKFGTESSLLVRLGKENRVVKHFKYTLWSDSLTVPEEALPLLDLIRIAQSNRGHGPVIIHCMNGFEKSGVYCTLANAVQQMHDYQEIDIPKIIRRLRLSRPQIVPNLEQFRFCYDAVMEYLNQFDTYQNL